MNISIAGIIVIAIIMAIFAVVWLIATHSEPEITLLACFIGMCGIFAAAVCFFVYQKMDGEKQLEMAAENGYVFYVDGSEVDLDHVDLSQYRASIDNEKQEVYLTGISR